MSGEGIAVIGMACVFPGAGDLETFRSNLVGGVDAVTDAPPGRIDPTYFAGPGSPVERFATSRGGFVDGLAVFDPASFGIAPSSVAGIEPDQLIALEVAAASLADAGLGGATIRSDRAGIVLGRGGYLNSGGVRLDQRVRGRRQLVEMVRSTLPEISAERLADLAEAWDESLPQVRPADAIGLVPNLAASRIANRLDLRGPAFTVDAACASSIVAVELAIDELRAGRSDVMLAGGVHHCHDATLWSIFSQLGALSPSGQIRPFGLAADGLVIGEGTGIVVLRRRGDAEAAGERIYAVIRGVGTASDGRVSSLMRPDGDGQVRALERAWADAALDPSSIGYLEGHGTGMPTGDQTELASIGRVFGPGARPHAERLPIGSVKSMLGHTMAAAGIAGLIKTALAVADGVVPPSLHADEELGAVRSAGCRVVTAAEVWDVPPAERVAGVNAFGFGGINAHIVLQGADSSQGNNSRRRGGRGRLSAPAPGPAEVLANVAALWQREPFFAAAGSSTADLLAQLDVLIAGKALGDGGTQLPSAESGSARLIVFDPTPDRLARARQLVERGRRWSGRHDIWFSPSPLLGAGGKVAFIFPGLEPSFEPRLDELVPAFGGPIDPGTGPVEVGQRAMAIITLGRVLDRALRAFGMTPDVVAGHSLGEWNALISSGTIASDEVDRFIASIDLDSVRLPDLLYAAVAAGADVLAEALADFVDVVVSHENCPRQSIICGPPESVRIVAQRLRLKRILVQEFPFRSGMHTPLFGPALPPFKVAIDQLRVASRSVPVWSTTTCAPFPDDEAAVRDLILRQLTEPVHFSTLVERLHQDGARVFVQVGVGTTLGFVDDVLGSAEVMTVPANAKERSGRAQLLRVQAALWVAGRAPSSPERSRRVPLVLGAPLISPDRPVRPDHPRPRPNQAPQDGGSESGPVTSRREIVVSLDTMPWLVDHCFYRQPDGADPATRFPVVPMTGMVELICEEARRLAPGRVVTAVRSVRALSWLSAAPERSVVVTARLVGPDEVQVQLEGHMRAIVELGDRYPERPVGGAAMCRPTGPATASPVAAEALYTDRWLFHGPAFQGVASIGDLRPDGLDGSIVVAPAPGATLDAAGQLMGYWIIANHREDRLALPGSIEAIRFFGPSLPAGEVLEVAIRVSEVAPTHVRADLAVSAGGSVWAEITGWVDIRFSSDSVIHPFLRFPETRSLAEPMAGGHVVVRERWAGSASRELMMRRYLSDPERQEYGQLLPLEQRVWLLGQIAAKDVVRHHVWAERDRPIFPMEVVVVREPGSGEVIGAVLDGRSFTVGVASNGGLAVAAVRDVAEQVDLDQCQALLASLSAAEIGLDARPIDAPSRPLMERYS